MRVLNEHHRSAYVSPSRGADTVIYFPNEFDEHEVESLGALLSGELNCPALAFANADDSEFWLGLYENGSLAAEASSRGSNHAAAAICCAFRRPWHTPAVWILLGLPFVLFELWRHQLLVKMLGIPDWSLASGHKYISRGQYPFDLDLADLIRTGRDPNPER